MVRQLVVLAGLEVLIDFHQFSTTLLRWCLNPFVLVDQFEWSV